jgi:hypothetical protein
MRPIDADALKEPLELQRASYARIGATERAEAYANCLWEIEQAPTIGGWISVKERLPENQVTVLIVKELKSGQRNIGLGYCIPEYKHHDYTTGEDRIAPYWVCGGNNNVIYWMPLPEMPKEVSECKT